MMVHLKRCSFWRKEWFWISHQNWFHKSSDIHQPQKSDLSRCPEWNETQVIVFWLMLYANVNEEFRIFKVWAKGAVQKIMSA